MITDNERDMITLIVLGIPIVLSLVVVYTLYKLSNKYEILDEPIKLTDLPVMILISFAPVINIAITIGGIYALLMFLLENKQKEIDDRKKGIHTFKINGKKIKISEDEI